MPAAAQCADLASVPVEDEDAVVTESAQVQKTMHQNMLVLAISGLAVNGALPL